MMGQSFGSSQALLGYCCHGACNDPYTHLSRGAKLEGGKQGRILRVTGQVHNIGKWGQSSSHAECDGPKGPNIDGECVAL